MRERIVLLSLVLVWMGILGGVDARAGELDCNNNGVPDAEELSGNDCNANGLLDICENDTLSNEVEFSAGRVTSTLAPSFDLEGDLLAIGSPFYRDSDNVTRNLLIIYRRIENAWILEQTIEWPDASAFFGSKVDISGDRIAVTAPNQFNVAEGSRGLVVIYHYDTGSQSWVEEAILKDPDFPSHRMGTDLSFVGEHLVVASVRGVSASPRIEHILCYRRVDGQWSQIQRIFSQQSAISSQGVRSEFVRLGPDTMVVSEVIEWPSSPWAAYVAAFYEFDGSVWRPTTSAAVREASTSMTPFLGIQISKDRIILPNSYPPGIGNNAGVSIFKRQAGQWVFDTFLNFTPAQGDGIQFGSAAGDGDRMFLSRRVGSSSSASLVVEEIVFDPGDTHIETRYELYPIDPGLTFDVSGNRVASLTYTPFRYVRVLDVSDDCDGDGILDECAIASGSADVDGDLVPDECGDDCNQDGIPDSVQISEGDCNANGVLDECDLNASDPDGDGFVATDCNGNGLPDACEVDCDGNGIPDACDLDAADPDGDGLVAADCDGNGVPDACDIRGGVSEILRLTPSDGDASVEFGRFMDIEDDLLVVGAPAASGGKVYVYRIVGNHAIESILKPAADAGDVYFGWRVAIEAGRIFVGQMANSSPFDYRIIVFEQVAGAWEEVDSILVSSDFYLAGSDFAVVGDTLLTYGPDREFATLYRCVDGVWSPERQYSEILQYGVSLQNLWHRGIAMSDDWIVFSGWATRVQLGMVMQGIGVVIHRNTDAGDAVEATFPLIGRTLLRPTGTVAINGDSVVVGFPFAEYPSSQNRLNGSADVISRYGDVWHRDARFFSPDISELLIGWSVAATGNQVFVASPKANASDGLIRHYESYGPMWTERAAIESPYVGEARQFGGELAASDRWLAVSAGIVTFQGTDPGPDSVVVYSIDLDVDDNGILDSCQADCDGNHYPDESELTTLGMVHALLSGGSLCVYDANDDGIVDSQDIDSYVELLLFGS